MFQTTQWPATGKTHNSGSVVRITEGTSWNAVELDFWN